MALRPSDYVSCPSCQQSNTVEFWDRNTKSEEGIKEDANFTSAGADKETHDEVQSYYRCPACNEEIDGVKLKK